MTDSNDVSQQNSPIRSIVIGIGILLCIGYVGFVMENASKSSSHVTSNSTWEPLTIDFFANNCRDKSISQIRSKLGNPESTKSHGYGNYTFSWTADVYYPQTDTKSHTHIWVNFQAENGQVFSCEIM